MRRSSMRITGRSMARIKVLVMDVDGTLTDGSIYICADGEAMKRFYVRDGHAIRHFLPEMGVTPVVITGRVSQIVARRCEELDIRCLVQGSMDKWRDLTAILEHLGATPEETAYIGDDVNDLDCMNRVGVCACPKDAVDAVRAVADYVTEAEGGHGAVREFIEWLGKRQ